MEATPWLLDSEPIKVIKRKPRFRLYACRDLNTAEWNGCWAVFRVEGNILVNTFQVTK